MNIIGFRSFSVNLKLPRIHCSAFNRWQGFQIRIKTSIIREHRDRDSWPAPAAFPGQFRIQRGQRTSFSGGRSGHDFRNGVSEHADSYFGVDQQG
jgi:hypothetical protein